MPAGLWSAGYLKTTITTKRSKERRNALIWFFLMGMVAGAAGLLLYAHYWIAAHKAKEEKDKGEVK